MSIRSNLLALVALTALLAGCESTPNTTSHTGDPDGGKIVPDSGKPLPDGGKDCNAVLPRPNSCAAGEFLYKDQSCQGIESQPDAGSEADAGDGGGAEYDAAVCSEEGDGHCYKLCDADKDCTDPCHPYCRVLGLYSNGDSSCNGMMKICRAQDQDDCPF